MKHFSIPEKGQYYSALKSWASILIITISFIPQAYAWGESDTSRYKSLLIIQTNDIHDHLRPNFNGTGGLPFVSGFIRDIKASRNDIIVLDGGDATEKGDLVARKTGSKLTFEAMSRVGYHAWTPGNHDHNYGIDALHEFSEIAGMDLLCINLLKADSSLEFSPSKIYSVNGLRVGIIGATAPRSERSLNLEGTARAMALESQKLEQETDIIIALVHFSSTHSAYLSGIAPAIDVFLSAHSHEVLHTPVVPAQSNTLIVQAGSYANYVGLLDLIIDTKERSIYKHNYKLIKMDHLKIPPDLEMIEWVRQKEMEIAPESHKVVSWTPRELNYIEIGCLAAEAIRKSTQADIAFNKTRLIVRSTLPAGILDLNSIYKTGGERGMELIETELYGFEIQSYLQGIQRSGWVQTQWSGLNGKFNGDTFVSDLELDRQYKVVMPLREWERRFTELFKRVNANPAKWPGVKNLNREISHKIHDLTWTDAMVMYLEGLKQKNTGIIETLDHILKETGQENLISTSGY